MTGTINASQNLYGNTNPTYGSVIANSYTQSSSCFSDPSIHLTPRNSCDQRPYDPSGDASIGSPSSSTAILSGHNRWCFLNKNHIRPYNDLDAFKRHVHDHHLQYHCIIPQELLVITKDGQKCVCGFANPDPGHFQEHNVPGCNGKRFTRKETLSRHLEKKHKFQDGSILAGQSKRPVDQKHFACGFCVHHCESLNALLNHIDRHYRDLKHISAWDDDRVIQGLLSQVGDYRRDFLVAAPYLLVWSLTWHPTHAQNMRHRLEMGQEPAATLVQAAIDNSNYRTSRDGHIKSTLVTDSTDEEKNASHSTQTHQREDGLSPLATTPEQDFLSHTPPTTAPTLQPQRLARDWAGFSNSGWLTDHEDHPSPQIASGTYGSPANTMYTPAEPPLRPYSSQKGDESSLQHQRLAYVPSNVSASYASQAVDSHAMALDYSTSSGHSPGVSRDVAAHPGSRQVIEMHPYSTRAGVGLFPATLANQSAASSLSPNREISSLHQLNRAYSPHYPTAPVHFSRHETRACNGMDTGFDLDNQQRFMHDLNRSQHQKRRG